MLPFEKKIWNQVLKKKEFIFLGTITLLALAVRYLGRNFISGDMKNFLLPWYEQFKSGGGFAALNGQIGNYNLLYQTIIAGITYIPISPLYLYKIISCMFDFLLAILAAKYACEIGGTGKTTFLLVYAIVLSLPTVFLNSAYWGQCDSMYTFFVVLCLYLLYKKKNVLAFLSFGIAVALKLQAVFILPFIIIYYFCSQSFSIVHCAMSLLSFWATGIVAFINGSTFFAPFSIYIDQASTYELMLLNIHSIWKIIGEDYKALHNVAMVVTVIILGVGLLMSLSHRRCIANGKEYIALAVWCLWTCLFFLPGMHERYTFPLDILLLILAFSDSKYIKFTVVSCILSAITYCRYLFGGPAVTLTGSVIYFVAWLMFTVETIGPESGTKEPTWRRMC